MIFPNGLSGECAPVIFKVDFKITLWLMQNTLPIGVKNKDTIEMVNYQKRKQKNSKYQALFLIKIHKYTINLVAFRVV